MNKFEKYSYSFALILPLAVMVLLFFHNPYFAVLIFFIIVTVVYPLLEKLLGKDISYPSEIVDSYDNGMSQVRNDFTHFLLYAPIVLHIILLFIACYRIGYDSPAWMLMVFALGYTGASSLLAVCLVLKPRHRPCVLVLPFAIARALLTMTLLKRLKTAPPI